jgi:iron complex transport system ATP-binding protein
MSMSLQCTGLGVRIGARTLLNDVSVDIPAGRLTAILGPNGAGKSTLLAVLSGLRSPSTGQVRLGDHALASVPPADLARQRAVMQQESAVAFAFNTREVVELGRYPHRRGVGARDEEIVDLAMQATGVADLAGRVFQTLSGGEKARAQLARALAQIWEPLDGGTARWLLLDEPTAALDLAHQHQTLRLAREWAHAHGVGVVVVLHDLNLALRYADDALVLSESSLRVHGPAAAVLTPELISEVWGVRCETATSAQGAVQYLFA